MTPRPTVAALEGNISADPQYWYRDANPGPTSNTSSAVRIDFQ
ncbi:MAG: hypothetical protein AAGG01_18820 [Planctomycetota bacterium]